MTNFKWFGSLVLAAAVVSTLNAETHCPGNVASVPFHVVNRHQIIVAVSVNKAGPFDFLLDTGTQMTMVDPSLAAELHLSTHGEAEVASAGSHATATFADLDSVQAGSHAVTNQKVLVYDLENLQAAGLKVQGVLGEDFLEQFDMLIDNAHSQLCLDESAAMRAEVKGQHVALLAPGQSSNQAGDGALPKSLIVSVKLSDGMRPVRLKLDSGANVPFLYNTSEYMALGAFRGASLQGGAKGAQRTFTALPLQNVKIGSLEMSKVLFVTLAGAQKDHRTSDFDGLLTMGLFRWVFVCHSDHFAVFGL